MQKIAFITGASSGFGKACAEKFACHGYDVIINGRREERLLELKEQLEKKYNTAEDVADVIYYCTTLPPHVCINDIVLTCIEQANAVYFHRKKG